jgi:hypothetical protein
MSATGYVWAKEFKTSLTSKGSNLLCLLGFLANSFGILRAGFQTAKTSEPAIMPFSAVSPLAVAYSVAALTHLPSFAVSSVARVYVTGYLSMIYCLLVISYLCLKSERMRGK